MYKSSRETKRGRKEKGFSITELLIAITVLSIGLVSVVGISAYVARSNVDSNAISVLATQAQSEVDSLRSATWTSSSCDAALTVGGSLTSNAANHNATVTGTPVGSVIVRWQVSQGTTADYRYVTVNAIRSGYAGDVKNGITLSTIISRK